MLNTSNLSNSVLSGAILSTEANDNTVHHVEIKAYLDNYQTLCGRVAALASAPPIDRVQNDIFFHCRSGRLKLRSSGEYHDLIYYRRNDDYGPSESFYQVAPTQNPAAIHSSLTSAFGEMGRVKKFRRTFKVGESVVHLDRVGGLGDFVEIKTELASPKQTAEEGALIVEQLMATLDVDLFQLVDGAYVDLINERNPAKTEG